MPGLNISGLPNTGDYQVGRGSVYFATLNASGFPTTWRDLGNCPKFSLNIQTKLLEHMSSRTGIKTIDAQVVVEQKLAVTLELDELNFENIALALGGDSEAYNNTAATSAVTPVASTSANLSVVGQGVWYDLYTAVTGIPATDPADARIYDIGTVTVKNYAQSTTYVAGVDYFIDRVLGRIFIIQGGAITGTVGSPTQIAVLIAANASADTAPSQVEVLTQPIQVGALKFVMQNPSNNDQILEWTFWKIQLVADGELGLISDEFMKLTLKGDAQANPTASPNSPTLTVRTHTHANGGAGNTLAVE